MSSIPASIRRAAAMMGRTIVDTVYPKTCAGCGMRGDWLCEWCDDETLRLNAPGLCARCGQLPFRGRCGCQYLPAVISCARSVAVYDGWVASAVKRVKYDQEPGRASHLASAMEPIIASMGPVDGLVPVPLHLKKQRERGYNQSVLLARHLSEATGIPVMDVLTRNRFTESQTRLTGRERWENVDGVFNLDPTWRWWPGKHYVLIDDVRTTGATLSACAKALEGASPGRLSVVTFALNLQKDELAAYRAHATRFRCGRNSAPR